MSKFIIKLKTEYLIEGDDEEDALDSLEDVLIPQIDKYGFQNNFDVKIVKQKVKNKNKK